MDAFLIFKFLHIASAIVWIGAGFGLVILASIYETRKQRDDVARVVQGILVMALWVFTPTSLAAFIFGVIAAWLSWGFADLWIWVGVAGFVATVLTGNFALKPRAQKVSSIVAKEGMSDNAAVAMHDLLQVSKFDYTVLFVVVFDMVYKPAGDDWIAIGAMITAVVLGAVAFLLPGVVTQRAPA